MSESETTAKGTISKSERYTHDNSESVRELLVSRKASEHAAFLLPYLHPGMRLLDAGCGPGTITLGLAEHVAPGEVIGIDQGADQIEAAKQQARQQSVRFEVADIYALPFPDQSFDAVYCNAVLAHLNDPALAVREFYRILKPGGVIGVRNGANRGFLITPPNPLLPRGYELYMQLVEANGGSPFMAPHQPALLRQAGFTKLKMSASLECSADPDQKRLQGEQAANVINDPSFGGKIVELGLADWEELRRIADAWRAWGEDPDSFEAVPWYETVAWKE